MAREYDKIKRTVQSVVTNLPQGGSVEVDELPLVGEPDTIYKLKKETQAFNWFACGFVKYDGIIQNNDNIVVVETEEELLNPSFDIAPYHWFIFKETNEVWIKEVESLHKWQDTEELKVYIITDFTEETVTLLDGTVAPWNDDAENPYETNYFYLFQNNEYQLMDFIMASGCKNCYETKIINSAAELPNEPEYSFVDIGGGQAEKYGYTDVEGNYYMYDMPQGWRIDGHLDFYDKPQDDIDGYILNCKPIVSYERYLYEDGKWVNIDEAIPAKCIVQIVHRGNKSLVSELMDSDTKIEYTPITTYQISNLDSYKLYEVPKGSTLEFRYNKIGMTIVSDYTPSDLDISEAVYDDILQRYINIIDTSDNDFISVTIQPGEL